ncbi:MAG: LysR family transcriptional regulator [Acidimicrobiia bacterium]
MPAVDLHHFRCAIALAEHGTFTRAAATMHMTQPSLSYVISRMESELGTALFDRRPRAVALTPAGEALLAPARAAVAEADRAAAAVAEVRGMIVGTLHVVSVRLAALELAAIVAPFHERHRAVRLTIGDPAGDGEVADQIRRREADVALMRSSLAPLDLVSIAITRQDVMVVGSAHTEPSTGPLSLADLAELPMIAPPASSPARRQFDRLFASQELVPNVVVECASHDLTLELVRLGVGVALTSAAHASAVDAGRVWSRPISGLEPTELCLVHRRSALSPAAGAFCREATGVA